MYVFSGLVLSACVFVYVCVLVCVRTFVCVMFIQTNSVARFFRIIIVQEHTHTTILFLLFSTVSDKLHELFSSLL